MAKAKAVEHVVLKAVLVPRTTNNKLKPVCPLCLSDPNPFHRDGKVQNMVQTEEGTVEELTLRCSNPDCLAKILIEYEGFTVQKKGNSDEDEVDEIVALETGEESKKRRGRKPTNRHFATDTLNPSFVGTQAADEEMVAQYKLGSIKKGIWHNPAGETIEVSIDAALKKKAEQEAAAPKKKTKKAVPAPAKEIVAPVSTEAPKKRGRPRKVAASEALGADYEESKPVDYKAIAEEVQAPKKRGRPRKLAEIDPGRGIGPAEGSVQAAYGFAEGEKAKLTVTRDGDEFLMECDNVSLRGLFPRDWKRSGVVFEISLAQIQEVRDWFSEMHFAWPSKFDATKLDSDYGSKTLELCFLLSQG